MVFFSLFRSLSALTDGVDLGFGVAVVILVFKDFLLCRKNARTSFVFEVEGREIKLPMFCELVEKEKDFSFLFGKIDSHGKHFPRFLSYILILKLPLRWCTVRSVGTSSVTGWFVSSFLACSY